MMTILEIKNLDTIRFTAIQFVKLIQDRPERVYCFNGDMGAGKTTFITEVCKRLGVSDTVNSPTFSIVNEYATDKEERVFHFDFYRIEKTEDALNIGVMDYFDSGDFCFVEWAENIAELIPEDAVQVSIEEISDGVRMLTIFENEK